MITTQNMFDALKQIGLNLYERKLWVALLSRGTATAGELSGMAKVPHSRTYDVLESLAEKGFVVVQTTKPLKYMTVAPNDSLERAKKKLKEDTEDNMRRITELQSSPILKELEKIYKQGMKLVEPGELTASLKGRNAMHGQLETLFKGAKSNISIMTTSEGLIDLNTRHGELLKKISDKGVKIRIAAPHSKESAETFEKFKSFASIKKVKKADIKGRMFIIDGSHTIFALTDDATHPTQDTAFWSQSEHVAKNLVGPMFDSIWEDLE